MLIHLAWRNIWRNKFRSIVLILAIGFGLWGGLFSSALFNGMFQSMVNSAIDRNLGHIQIHNPQFSTERRLGDTILDPKRIKTVIHSLSNISAASSRTLIDAMASSANASFAVTIVGINKKDEASISNIDDKLVEGSFFDSPKKSLAVIGNKLAERLKLKIRSKIILTFQDIKGEITYLHCRVIGIYKSNSANYDQSHIYVQQKDIKRVLNSPNIPLHEIAIRIKDDALKAQTIAALKQAGAHNKVEEWKEIAPQIAFFSEMSSFITYILVGIILFALLFGIVNNMLMSVLERTRELGILTALGMRKWKITLLISLETLFISLVGGVIGSVITILQIGYYSKTGIDLSISAKAFEKIGGSSLIFPSLPWETFIILALMIIITSNIAAFMPAWRAAHIEPANAIRE